MDTESVVSQVKEIIVQIVRKCVCVECGFIPIDNIIYYPLISTAHNDHHTTVPLKTDDEYVQYWCAAWNLDKPLEKTIEDIRGAARKMPSEGFTPDICVALLFSILRLNRTLPMHEVDSHYTRIRQFDLITRDEWILVSAGLCMGTTHVRAYIRRNLQHVQESRVKAIHLEDHWIMQNEEYDSLIQWLPREMLEDVTVLFQERVSTGMVEYDRLRI